MFAIPPLRERKDTSLCPFLQWNGWTSVRSFPTPVNSDHKTHYFPTERRVKNPLRTTRRLSPSGRIPTSTVIFPKNHLSRTVQKGLQPPCTLVSRSTDEERTTRDFFRPRRTSTGTLRLPVVSLDSLGTRMCVITQVLHTQPNSPHCDISYRLWSRRTLWR